METIREKILRTTTQVMKNATMVNINDTKIDDFARELIEYKKRAEFGVFNWRDNFLHPNSFDRDAIHWILLIDALNFSFWHRGSVPYTVEYRGKMYTGYWSLCAAVNRAVDEGIDILNPLYWTEIDEREMEMIFRSETTTSIPLLEKRLAVVRETGQVLVDHFGGDFTNLLKEVGGNSQKFLELIDQHFESFRDYCEYQGETVYFYKRAQILVADIWACAEGKDLGYFDDIQNITMFADYRVPQILVQLGIMEYTDDLIDYLKSGKLVTRGSQEEVEIRAASILSVEYLQKAYDLLTGEPDDLVNAITIDFFLWDAAKKAEGPLANTPIHKIETHFY